MSDSQNYNLLMELVQNCSTKLDSMNGFVLPGSPSMLDNIKEHHAKFPSGETKFGMSLIDTLTLLTNNINTSPERYMSFMEDVR